MNIERLQSGLENGEFIPLFQPYFDSHTLNIRGVEVLARWVRPDGTVLCPQSFMHYIEEYGLGRELTLTLLEQAIPVFNELERRIIPFSLSINVSVQELQDKQFARSMFDCLVNQHFPMHKLVLEIKDAALMSANTKLTAAMIDLKKKHVTFAIDSYDFTHAVIAQPIGSLFNELKIDSNTVKQNQASSIDLRCFPILVNLARELELKVSVKGIENQDQIDEFARLGSDYLQGYAFARPMNKSQIIDYAETLLPTSASIK